MTKDKSGINAASYDKISEQWADARGHSSLSGLVTDFAAKMKSTCAGGHILDIGCGTGSPNAQYLSDCGFHVTGIDISPKLIEYARSQNIPNADFFVCDFFDFEPTQKFDGIIAFDSFFHFPKERQCEIYARVSAWMADGAYLLFTHGSADSEIDGVMFGETFYYSALNTAHVHELILQAGLSVEESIINYREEAGNRDFVIYARKKAAIL
jgi:Cyclopropane fatty acid synthase and related methyltransferases